MRYPDHMQDPWRSMGITLLLFAAPALASPAEHPVWPLTLREGLPANLPGYAPAPKDELPDTYENEMGKYVEIGRFFLRIESATSTKQFRVAIQDYDGG